MKRYSVKLYRRLMGLLKPYWPIFILAALGSALCGAADSYSAYLFKPLLDKGFINHNHHFLRLFPLIVVGIFLLRGLGSVVSTYAIGWVSKKLVLTFRERLFAHMMKLPAAYFDRSASGNLLGVLTYNVDQVIQATGPTFTTLVQQTCLLFGLIIVMLVTNWELTLITFLILPFLVVFVRNVSNRFRKLSRRIQNTMGDVIHIAEESISGYREVKLFAGEKQQINQFQGMIHYNFVQEMKLILTDALSSPIIQLLCSVILALVIYVAIDSPHHMSAGSFIAMLTAMLASFKPIRDLSQINSSIQRGLAAAEGIFGILDAEPEHDQGTKILHRASGEIQFQDVGFRYGSDSRWVLRDINFHIAAGQTIAFVGRSGAGKSTIMSLLARFYAPTQGQILLDNIDINTLVLSNLREQLAIVSQHVVLFDNTIYHNIAYGLKEKASMEEVVAAAKAAHAWEFIAELPQGLETLVGENGLNLSGGQRQRLAIARAILKNAPILILDEATSSLDNESERAIQDGLEVLRKNRTTLIVAHRLSTIEQADKIVVMDQSRIVEVGTHQELLATGGVYAQLQKSATFE